MINIKKIKPMFNALVTTMDKYKDDFKDGKIITLKKKGSIKEIQKVIAVGDSVRSIQVGDYVYINPERYKVIKHEDGSMKDGVISDNVVLGYKFKTIKLDGIDYLMLYDQDIDFIVTEHQDEETASPIITPKDDIIA